MRLSTTAARDRFRPARVARLATVGPTGTPHLVPVTFAMVPAAADGRAPDVIVFAVDHKPKSTTALRRLDNIAANPRVAFLVDVYDENWDHLWWCRADAEASILQGDARHQAIVALREKYPQYESTPPDGVVVGGAVTGWSGWQATAFGSADGAEPPLLGSTAP